MDLQFPTFPDAAKLILRLPVGIVFVFHGAQKLFGAFGGHGIQGFAKFLGSMGIPYPELNAWLAGGSEFFLWISPDLWRVRPLGYDSAHGGHGCGHRQNSRAKRFEYGRQRL